MTPDTFYYVVSAFLVGLMGGVHCVGMCGGIMNALVFALPEDQRSMAKVLPKVLLYNVGRIASYATAGAILGALGAWMQLIASPAGLGLRIMAGAMLVAMGFYLAGWWRGLARLERLGGHLWKYLHPIANRLMPVRSAWQALLLGAIWGWLPCGLVYSALTLAAGVSHWYQSALVMVAFGVGTLPVMVVTGSFAAQVKAFIQQKLVRNIAALLVIAFGIWTMLVPVSHLMEGSTTHHGRHEKEVSHTEGIDDIEMLYANNVSLMDSTA